MLAWLTYWLTKPDPKPPAMPTIEVIPRDLYPRTRYTMTPPRLLEWWAQSPALDPLPPLPEEEKHKGEV